MLEVVVCVESCRCALSKARAVACAVLFIALTACTHTGRPNLSSPTVAQKDSKEVLRAPADGTSASRPTNPAAKKKPAQICEFIEETGRQTRRRVCRGS